mgnify:CR=1 FL=1
MPSVDQVAGKIRNTLRLTDPDLDTTIGTPVRKIIDAVAEAIAEASTDAYLVGYQYDIDTKSGAELDDFVKLFGFSRLPARRATGLVTFERTTPASQPITLPPNTQLITDSLPQVIIATVTPGVFSIGATTVTVPGQAVVSGSAGNISAHSVGRALTTLQGVSSFSNPQAFTGGVDAETDAALRARFKRTIFRSMAGTESMYLATALEHPNVVQANVVSAVKRQREQIQITSGTGTSSLASTKFIYPDTSALGPNINSGDILTPDIHYSFSAITNPPTVTSLSGSVMPDGIYDLEFDYLSAASRNDPDGFITNRVDIWVRGQRPTEAIETMVFSSGRIFNSISGSELNRNNFQRENETLPEANNFFIPFGFSPVIDPSPNGDVMVINGVTYIRNTHYWLVQDITPKGMSNRGFSGVEFKSLTNGLALAEPANGQHWSQTYIFDAAPRDIDVSVQRWRMVTNDLWVHAARRIKLKAYFAVILTPGYNLAAVTDAVYTALSAFTQEVSFDQVLQASDVLAVAHAVPGVDAVRFLTSTDNPTNYAWQRLDPADTVLHTYATGGRAIDIFCDDDTVVDLSDVVLVAKAQNTWSTV